MKILGKDIDVIDSYGQPVRIADSNDGYILLMKNQNICDVGDAILSLLTNINFNDKL